MGLFRKSTSVFTLGVVDFRSDKERTARSSRKGHKATKKTNKLLREQNRLQSQANAQAEALLRRTMPDE